MEGYIAQELVYHAPQRVAAMVIVGSTNITMPISWWERWAMRVLTLGVHRLAVSHLKGTVARSTALDPGVREYAERDRGHDQEGLHPHLARCSRIEATRARVPDHRAAAADPWRT